MGYLFDNQIEISVRTFDRTIEQIRYEFGVDIKYDKEKKGYYIDYELNTDKESFYKFLEIITTAELLTESIKDGIETLKYVQFESQNNLKGIEHLKDLLLAVREHRTIKFKYQKFHTREKTDYIIEPYLLKEYQNRWYIFGKIPGTNNFRTFGIDRIHKLKITTDRFNYNSEENKSYYFDYVIGLNYSAKIPEDIILSFVPEQAYYVKTLPFHNSQEIIIDDENELRIKLTVIPNFELEQKILMQGERVKVIEPEWLADKIKERLKEAIKKY